MEVKIQRPAYYFSWLDEEILDEKLLDINGDDETWLYRVERNYNNYNGHFQTPTQPNHYHSPSGSLDSRTYTRRKHSMRPSLESVAESPLSNRSSLGILSTSRLNDSRLVDCSRTQISTNQGRISSSFTVSDKAPVPRVFKLDTPLMNNPFDRKRHDSELSDSYIIPSLDSQFDKCEVMTDSLVNFLEKPNDKCQPPIAFQDEKPMTESVVSLSDDGRGVELHEEAMTDSMVNFLEPVACKPPSGFADEEMSNSIVNIDEKDILPTSDMTNSLMDYLDSGNIKTVPSTFSTTCNEAENIPPERINNRVEESGILNHTDRTVNGRPDRRLNARIEMNHEKDVSGDDIEDYSQFTFTNVTNVNISRTNRRDTLTKDDLGLNRPLNTTFEKEIESDYKVRALNNKDLNVTQDLNDEAVKEFNLARFKIHNKTNSPSLQYSAHLNSTFTKSGIDNSPQLNNKFTKVTNDNSAHFDRTFTRDRNVPFTKKNLNSTFRQIPDRNSTFNTTFTKLDPPSDISRSSVTRSTECLDTGMEDDRTSSASDSSFSSAASSSKPRSVDELRTIALQQETDLQRKTSTPSEKNGPAPFALPDSVDMSPIRNESRRVVETRSAHSSPVRSPLSNPPRAHPISRLQQPMMEMRRQNLQASSMSNLTLVKPRASGLRMPQASRVSMLVRPDQPRPSTAPASAPATTGIPRPQVASRLPMPRARASGIPTIKRGGRH